MYEEREAKQNVYKKYQRKGRGERSKFGVLLCDHAATYCQGRYGSGLIFV
jgi:hypothetical protein